MLLGHTISEFDCWKVLWVAVAVRATRRICLLSVCEEFSPLQSHPIVEAHAAVDLSGSCRMVIRTEQRILCSSCIPTEDLPKFSGVARVGNMGMRMACRTLTVIEVVLKITVCQLNPWQAHSTCHILAFSHQGWESLSLAGG